MLNISGENRSSVASSVGSIHSKSKCGSNKCIKCASYTFSDRSTTLTNSKATCPLLGVSLHMNHRNTSKIIPSDALENSYDSDGRCRVLRKSISHQILSLQTGSRSHKTVTDIILCSESQPPATLYKRNSWCTKRHRSEAN